MAEYSQVESMVDIVMEFLRLSASVDVPTSGQRPPQWTALHLAACNSSRTGDSVAVMEAIIAARADPMVLQ